MSISPCADLKMKLTYWALKNKERRFADDIFNCIFKNEKFGILRGILGKVLGRIDN